MMEMSSIARALVLGDIHAEDDLLALALAVGDAQNVDAVLAVGDVVDGRGDVDRAVALLAERSARVVAGNHERWCLYGTMRDLPHAHRLEALAPRTTLFLGSLPKTLTLPTASGALLLCHGVGDNDMRRLRPFDEGYELACNDELNALVAARRHALMIGGHTHLRMLRRFEHLLVMNPGTLVRDEEPACLVVDFRGQTTQFFELTTEGATAGEVSPWP